MLRFLFFWAFNEGFFVIIFLKVKALDEHGGRNKKTGNGKPKKKRETNRFALTRDGRMEKGRRKAGERRTKKIRKNKS